MVVAPLEDMVLYVVYYEDQWTPGAAKNTPIGILLQNIREGLLPATVWDNLLLTEPAFIRLYPLSRLHDEGIPGTITTWTDKVEQQHKDQLRTKPTSNVRHVVVLATPRTEKYRRVRDLRLDTSAEVPFARNRPNTTT